MDKVARSSPLTDAFNEFVRAPSLGRRTRFHHPDSQLPAENSPHTRQAQGSEFDPHSLRDSAPLVYVAYTVAIESHPKLLNRTLTEEAVVAKLRRMAPRSGFRFDYVTRQVFKLINPYGHGANSPRFRNEALGCFRHIHPEDAHLTAGFIALLCAAKWWANEQGHRLITPGAKPLGMADLDLKLKSFGFLAGERQAICRMLRRPKS